MFKDLTITIRKHTTPWLMEITISHRDDSNHIVSTRAYAKLKNMVMIMHNDNTITLAANKDAQHYTGPLSLYRDRKGNSFETQGTLYNYCYHKNDGYLPYPAILPGPGVKLYI